MFLVNIAIFPPTNAIMANIINIADAKIMIIEEYSMLI